ncbi:hypothetical protein ACQKWADRAFT_286654 [Trichoderma austrokoningii]
MLYISFVCIMLSRRLWAFVNGLFSCALCSQLPACINLPCAQETEIGGILFYRCSICITRRKISISDTRIYRSSMPIEL